MRRRNGFTLVEALIAVAAGLLVLGVGVQLFGWAARALTRADQHLDARETALRTMSSVRDVLADCTMYAIAPAKTSVEVTSKVRTGKLAHDPATGKLTFTKGAEVEVLARGVTSLTFTRLARGLVRVALKVERPKVENKLAELAPLTLTDDVLVPLVSAKALETPWQKVTIP